MSERQPTDNEIAEEQMDESKSNKSDTEEILHHDSLAKVKEETEMCKQDILQLQQRTDKLEAVRKSTEEVAEYLKKDLFEITMKYSSLQRKADFITYVLIVIIACLIFVIIGQQTQSDKNIATHTIEDPYVLVKVPEFVSVVPNSKHLAEHLNSLCMQYSNCPQDFFTSFNPLLNQKQEIITLILFASSVRIQEDHEIMNEIQLALKKYAKIVILFVRTKEFTADSFVVTQFAKVYRDLEQNLSSSHDKPVYVREIVWDKDSKVILNTSVVRDVVAFVFDK